MSRGAVEPVATNDAGDETHPAFGSIRAARITSNPGSVLFDSEIRHPQFVRVTIGHMSRRRDLNRDWLHPERGAVAEVDMSESQWASFVSSVNTSAVPCTLRLTETCQDVPVLPFAPRLEQSAKETGAAARKAFADIEAAFAVLRDLDPKAGVKARREAMHSLGVRIANAPSNVEFASRSLTEHTENVVQKARADIEAMMDASALRLGIEAPAESVSLIES